MPPNRIGRHLRQPLHGEKRKVSEDFSVVVEDLRIIRIKPVQFQSHLNCVAVAIESGVGTFKLQATEALHFRIEGTTESLFKTWQCLPVTIDFREGHGQEDFRLGQTRLQLKCALEFRDRLIEFSFLEVDQSEVGMHLGDSGLQIPQLLVSPFGCGVVANCQGLLTGVRVLLDAGVLTNGNWCGETSSQQPYCYEPVYVGASLSECTPKNRRQAETSAWRCGFQSVMRSMLRRRSFLPAEQFFRDGLGSLGRSLRCRGCCSPSFGQGHRRQLPSGRRHIACG